VQVSICPFYCLPRTPGAPFSVTSSAHAATDSSSTVTHDTPTSAVTAMNPADMESLKQEIIQELRKEMHKIKDEIIQGSSLIIISNSLLILVFSECVKYLQVNEYR